MFNFKKIFDPAQAVEEYAPLTDYLRSDTLPIYREDDKLPIKVGNVPRIITTTEDANNIYIEIKYPIIPLISNYQKNHYVQFNGTDIYLTNNPSKEENLYVPMKVYVHLTDQKVEVEPYHVSTQYGITQILHTVPCQEIAESATKTLMQQYKVLVDGENKERLKLANWRFKDGELHVFTTLVPTIVSKLHINGFPNNIRYQPTPVFYENENGEMDLSLTITDDECRELVDRMIPETKYHRTITTTSQNRIDEIHVVSEIRTEYFPDEYVTIKPFVEYLDALGFYIDDELMYDYFQSKNMMEDAHV